jgi:hypothetical protein
MLTGKAGKPAFQSVEIDLIDQRLDAQAAEKGIPTLVIPKLGPPEAAVDLNAPEAAKGPARRASRGAGTPVQCTPRDRMKTLNIEVPDYAWIAIKMRAAQDMVSVRHVIMLALRADGIEIKDADMIEDGRRLRGNESV